VRVEQKDAWIILQNKVYNVSSVLSWHPGGASAILAYAGKATVEATTAYASIHDGYANEQRDKLLIGKHAFSHFVVSLPFTEFGPSDADPTYLFGRLQSFRVTR
jgi:cytochrome b involved in lipid metabolism